MILLAAVPLALILVVLLNTARRRSRQTQTPPIDPVVLDESLCAKHLSEVIQFKTVTRQTPERIDPAPFLALHEYLNEAFPLASEALQCETVGEDGLSLLYTWKGTDSAAESFLLMSHIDVVPVGSDDKEPWTHPAFGGKIVGGYIWGRGALDVKCGAVAILEAVEFLLTKGFQPASSIYIAMGHDEEVGGKNGNAIIATLLKQRGVRLRYVLDEGGAVLDGVIQGPTSPVAFIGVAEKGHAGLRLVATGPGGHASMPPGQTAVGILAAAIAQLESHPMPTRLDGAASVMLDYLGPEMPFSQRVILANRWLFRRLVRRQFAKQPTTNATIRTTWAATMVKGSIAENVLPTKASAHFNLRLLPGDTAESVLTRVRQVIGDDRVTCSIAPDAREASAVSCADSAEFSTLSQTIREVLPDVIVAPGLATVSTDSPHYRTLTDNTFRFIPMRIAPEDLPRIHGVDERIAVENYLEIIRFFIQQIRNSAS